MKKLSISKITEKENKPVKTLKKQKYKAPRRGAMYLKAK